MHIQNTSPAALRPTQRRAYSCSGFLLPQLSVPSSQSPCCFLFPSSHGQPSPYLRSCVLQTSALLLVLALCPLQALISSPPPSRLPTCSAGSGLCLRPQSVPAVRGRVAVALYSHSSILFPISRAMLVTALLLPAFQQLLKFWQQPVRLCCQKVLQAQGLILCQSPACASCQGAVLAPQSLCGKGASGLSAVQHLM